jgi:pantoate--beta-alanine ligase
MTQVFHTPEEIQKYRSQFGSKLQVGFVPTMGALHDGHKKLIETARKENDISILSIFVNPTQFNNSTDLEKYPKTWEADLQMANRENINAIYAPNYINMYPDHYKYKISESELSLKFCGAHRPGHFDGVLTIVMKLFNLIRPHKAYFGEKDYQQLKLIENMVSAFFMNLEIVAIPTIREKDGLAMSSRNVRLSEQERLIAPLFFKTLISAESAQAASKKLSEAGFKVDYVEDWNHRRIAAVHLGSVRLIDNVKI